MSNPSIERTTPGKLGSASHANVLLQTLLTVLPVLTAGLYLLGLTYHQGYLEAYGIDDSVFPLSSDKALFNGFFSLLVVSFPGILYMLGAIGAFVVLVMVVAVLSSTARVKAVVANARSWIEERRPDQPIVSPVANDLVDKGAALYGYATGLLLALVLPLVMAALSAKSGKEQAEKEIANFSAGKATSAQLFSPELPAPYTGKLVMCGEKYCAFWGSNGTIIIGHEGITKIITSKPALVGKSASAP